jgi:DNA-binding NarL/FixJ family response regulator
MSRTLPKADINFLRRQHNELVGEEERLTDRQREVLQLLAEGKVMKEVGSVLGLRTRAFHKYRIMERVGAKSNADLVKYAVKKHLIAA